MRNKSFKSKSGRTHKRRFHGLQNHPFIIPVVTFLVLFFVSLVGYVSLNGRTVGASDVMTVNLSIDGNSQVIPTRAQTVRELLDRAHLTLGEKDIVEPALDTPIEKDNTTVNVYRARPVLVEDRGKKSVAYTAEQTPQAVAAAAGFDIHPEDTLVTVPAEEISATDVLREGIVAQRVVIDRADEVNLNLYGTPVPIRTHASTVAELLTEKNVVLNEGDTLQPGLETILTNGMQIFVVRVGKTVVSEEQAIPAPLETIDDPNLAAGTTVVRQAGSDGRKVVTYELELHNGAEASRRVIQEVLAAEPVKRIVVKGSKLVISDPAANVVLGQQIAGEMGWSGEFSCIYQIFQRESKWNHLARNRNTGAYGIPQALPGSKMGPGWESDPGVQIHWGINYMVQRYGSPCKANSFWQVNGWY